MIMDTLQKLLKKINIACPLLFSEPIHLHTSFRIGGPADVFAKPQHEKHIKEIFSFSVNLLYPEFHVFNIPLSFSTILRWFKTCKSYDRSIIYTYT